MRVLFIARYLQSINQKKIELLSQQPGLTLWHLAPNRWQDAFNRYQLANEAKNSYVQIAQPVLNAPDIHRFIYWPPPMLIRSFKPDVIHLEEEPESLVALEINLLRRWLAPRSKLVLFTWQNLRRQLRRPVNTITRFNLQAADGIICGNRDAAEVIRTHGFKGPTIILPQLGIDPTDFASPDRSAQRTKYRLNRFTVGYFGRLVEEKGIWLLLEALEHLSTIQLLFVGQGPLFTTLQAKSTETVWQDRLILAGSLSHQATAQTLSALDTLVLPSLTRPNWKEQFGHVLIEAMAGGIPIIGSNSGAIPEVVGAAGLIFPEGDVSALRTCVLRLQSDSALRAELIAHGKVRVRDHYTHQHIAEQTYAFYQKLFASSAGPSSSRKDTS